MNYKPVSTFLGDLVDCRRYNCNYLLNTGLRGDGSVNPTDKCLLGEVGKWIRANKNFIYGVRGSDCACEGGFVLEDEKAWYIVVKDVVMAADPNVQRRLGGTAGARGRACRGEGVLAGQRRKGAAAGRRARRAAVRLRHELCGSRRESGKGRIGVRSRAGHAAFCAGVYRFYYGERAFRLRAGTGRRRFCGGAFAFGGKSAGEQGGRQRSARTPRGRAVCSVARTFGR